ncbi:MAG TPA: SMC-Scp complex subunit ScpB [Pyrinomonadaceae bacterium]|jgi:segregation and condensation protein B
MSEERDEQRAATTGGGPDVDGGAADPFQSGPAAGAAVESDADAADDETGGAAADEEEDAEGASDVDDAEGADDEADEAADDAGAAVVIFDADAEDRAEELAALAAEGRAAEEAGPAGPRSMAELMGIIEALVFVSEEPLAAKTIADLLDEERGWVEVALEELAKEFNERNGGLLLREVAGGWQIATRPEYHEHVRAFLKSRPSAKLSLAALETLAVIAYKQPITIPEIMEIRGVQSTSAIKTLLDKRLIIAKGRKETIGRPMMYGTSKEFLLQFGLKDLTELPNVEDFEDLAGGT